MSGFYLTLTTVKTGFGAAEESVRMLDAILGSNETSRALSSIITLVRSELTQDPRFCPAERGAVSSLGSLTKALTAFACLQTATHRRTLKEMKLRVIYDCTVVMAGESETEEQPLEERAAPAGPPSSQGDETVRESDGDTIMTDVRSAIHSRRNSLAPLTVLDDSGTITLELEELIGAADEAELEQLPAEVREALRHVHHGGSRQHSPGLEIEIEVEETTTTTTTTVRTRESSHENLHQAIGPRRAGGFELEALSEDDWIEVPSNLSSRRGSAGDELALMGEMPTALNGSSSSITLASFSREDTLHNPEEGKQRLQVCDRVLTALFESTIDSPLLFRLC